MPTIPTGRMERELRKLYLRWLAGIGRQRDIGGYIDTFEKQSMALIEKMGGQTAALGALADFPVPKALDLSPHVGTIYSDMKQAAIASSITAGLNAKDAARAMFNAGMDKSYHRLERLARTETVSAYWKNAWGSISDLPALVMVWGAEDGPRTCAWCRERDGLVMASSDLRDHPNGRCTPIPTLRSQVDYRGSVDRDGSIFHDPAWSKPITPTAPMTVSSLGVALRDGDLAAANKAFAGKPLGSSNVAVEFNSVGRQTFGEFVDTDGNPVGYFSRTFESKDTVRHNSLELDVDARRQGIATAFNKEMEQAYRDMGVQKIVLTAGLDDGGYVWAKAGYDWDVRNGFKAPEGWHYSGPFAATDEAGKAWLKDLDKKFVAAERASVFAKSTNPKYMISMEERDRIIAEVPKPWEIANIKFPGFTGADILRGSEWKAVKVL